MGNFIINSDHLYPNAIDKINQSISSIDSVCASLTGYSLSGHTHEQYSLSGTTQTLSASLSGYSPINHNHNSTYSTLGHGHTLSNITDYNSSNYVFTSSNQDINSVKKFNNQLIISGNALGSYSDLIHNNNVSSIIISGYGFSQDDKFYNTSMEKIFLCGKTNGAEYESPKELYFGAFGSYEFYLVDNLAYDVKYKLFGIQNNPESLGSGYVLYEEEVVFFIKNDNSVITFTRNTITNNASCNFNSNFIILGNSPNSSISIKVSADVDMQWSGFVEIMNVSQIK